MLVTFPCSLLASHTYVPASDNSTLVNDSCAPYVSDSSDILSEGNTSLPSLNLGVVKRV